MKRLLPFTAGALLSMLVLAGCTGPVATSPSESASAGDLLTSLPPATGELDDVEWAYYAALPTLDPLHSTSREAGLVIVNLCDTLLRTEPDLTLSDNLATMERIDDTHYELTIVDGATFWDGSPVTSADVVYSLNRNLDPAVGSDFAQYFANVKEIVAEGERTVAVTMAKPDILFEKALGTLGAAVMDKEFSESAGEDLGSLQGNIMCSGPFKIESSDPSAKIVLTRNDDYWDEDGIAMTQTVTINYLPDGATAAAALQSGDVSGMFNYPAVAMSQLDSSGKGSTYTGLSNFVFAFVVGNLPGNPLEDVSLRQALSLAMDRTAVAQKVFPGGGTAATTMLGSAAAAEVASTTTLNDVAKLDEAKKLVDAYIAKNGEPRPIKLSYTSGVGAEVGQMALYLEQVAKSIGLTVELDDKAPLEWIQGVMGAASNPTFDLTFSYGGRAINDPFTAYTRVLLPTSSDNISGYDNASVSSLIDEGRATLDADERSKIAAQIEDQALADLPYIPVVRVPRQVFVNSAIGGVVLSDASFMGYPWAARLGAK